MPVGAESLAEALRTGAEVFHALKAQLAEAGHNTNVGDEGGFAPDLASSDEALGFIMKAVEAAGYKPGDEVVLALDCAATEFFKDGAYRLAGEEKTLDAGGMADYLATLCDRYPIVSVEDGMAEDDWEGWSALTAALGDVGTQIFGFYLSATLLSLFQAFIFFIRLLVTAFRARSMPQLTRYIPQRSSERFVARLVVHQ